MESEKADKSASYIIQRVTASGKPCKKPVDKAHTIILQTALLPFFTATNAIGLTRISQEALDKPLELAKNPDGSVKFSKAGKPVVKVAREISENLKLIKCNLKNYDANFDLNKFIESLTADINHSITTTGDPNPELNQKIRRLFQHQGEKDSSLDELEHEQKSWPLLPGSYESGKHR